MFLAGPKFKNPPASKLDVYKRQEERVVTSYEAESGL